MGLETGTFIDDLVPSNPVGPSDPKSQGDDHLRLLKSVLQNTFPNAGKAFRFPGFLFRNANYTILAADQNSLISASGALTNITLTLPTLAAGDDGWSVYVYRADNIIANSVTIAGTINNVTNYSLERQFQYVKLTWSGSTWIATAENIDLPYRVVTKNATATLTAAEMKSVVFSTPAADITITPPAAVRGDWVYIKNLSATKAVVFDPPGAVTVDGSASFALAHQYEAALFVTDGTNWFVLDFTNFPVIPAHPSSSVVNLTMTNQGAAPDSKMVIQFDEAVLVDTSGNSVKHMTGNIVWDILAAAGANAMDTAGSVVNTGIFIWLISNGTTISAIGHRTTTNAPTMPGGYTYKKLIGWTRTDGSGHLYRLNQIQDDASWIVGVLPDVSPQIDRGPAGTFNAASPTLALAAWNGFAPSNAKLIRLSLSNCFKNSAAAGAMVAPNASWGGGSDGPTGINGNAYPGYLGDQNNMNITVDIVPESTNIAWTGAGTGAGVCMLGWKFPL